MIRVLHVMGSLATGGMESFVLNIYRKLDRSSIQFDFLITSHAGWNQSYADEIINLGGHIYEIPTKRIDILFSFLKKKKYKIIHSHRDAMSGIYLSAAKICHIPTRISHCHTTNYKGIKRLLSIPLKKIIPFVATDMFACGSEAGKWLFGNHKFNIVTNAIDTKRFLFEQDVSNKIKKDLNLDNSSIIVGHVGRFEYPKNHKFLLDVFKDILVISPKSKLLLVGDGSLRENIEQQAKETGIYDSCIFLGNVANINEIIQCFDVVVFPSHFEGFSIAMIEIQTASIPILASMNIPKEINITGLVSFKSLDSNSTDWADETVRIALNNKKINREKQICEAGLSINQLAAQIQDFYISKK